MVCAEMSDFSPGRFQTHCITKPGAFSAPQTTSAALWTLSVRNRHPVQSDQRIFCQ